MANSGYRSYLLISWLILLIMVIPALSPVTGSDPGTSPLFMINATCSPLMVNDPEFDFEFRRTLGSMYSGCADLGEVIATASRMDPLTYETWFREWTRTADHFREVGDEASAAGHSVSAHDAWLRASTYYRTAEFFLHRDPADPRIVETWEKSRDTFQRAMERESFPVSEVAIPYGNTTLPGYLYLVDDSGKQRPLLIIQTGYDGTQEELYPNAREGIRRGYNVLTFEGPGQGEVIRVQQIPFRPDWEAVVTPVLDWAVARPEVDQERIALWGISMGGYLAPRAAAFDNRISALIADSGIYDMASDMVNQFRQTSPDPDNLTREDVFSYVASERGFMNADMYARMNNSTSTDWMMTQGMYVFRVPTPADVMLIYRDYTLEGVIGEIRCPTLVSDGASDSKMGSQAAVFYDHLTCPRTYLPFSNEYCAGEHCQLGASAISYQGKFDWLDDQLHPDGKE